MIPPRIVELVGVAGAGKSTLAQALGQSCKRVKLIDHPYFREVEQIPFFVWNTLLMGPTLVHLYARCGIKCLTPLETATLVILHGWQHRLRRQASNGNVIFVMDQGPVSMMAEICVSGPKCLLSQTSKKWWENTLKSWANVLDMLIWLDTSDPILVERVRTRKKWHLIKDWNDQDALDFNILYRSVYTQLISELTIEANGPEVIRLDTGQLSLNEIIDNVLVALKIKDREVYISR